MNTRHNATGTLHLWLTGTLKSLLIVLLTITGLVVLLKVFSFFMILKTIFLGLLLFVVVRLMTAIKSLV